MSLFEILQKHADRFAEKLEPAPAPALTDEQIAAGWFPRPGPDEWPQLPPDTLVDVVFYDGEYRYAQTLGTVNLMAMNRYRPTVTVYPPEEGWKPWNAGWPAVSPSVQIEIVLANHMRFVRKATSVHWWARAQWKPEDEDCQQVIFWREAPVADEPGASTASDDPDPG